MTKKGQAVTIKGATVAGHGSFSDWAERASVFGAVSTVMEGYEFSDRGLVINPGKHEGNPVQALYFWERAMDGDGDNVGAVTIFEASPVEREMFGAMPDCKYFAVEESDTGFVYGQWISNARKARLEEQEAQADDSDDPNSAVAEFGP